jgi:hypothetical protein
MKIIADITRAFDSTESKFIDALKTRMQSNGATSAVIVAHERQKNRFSHNFDLFTVNDWLTPEQIAAVIQEQLLIATLKNSQDQVEILSLIPRVLELADSVPAFAKSRVKSFHWFKIPPLGQEWRGSSTPPVADWSESAIAALIQLLAKFPNGLRKSSLRDALVAISNEFEKRPGGASISALVAVAQKRGLVEAYSLDGIANPQIKLISKSPIAPSSITALVHPVQAPPSSLTNDVVQTEVTAPDMAAGLKNNEGRNDKPLTRTHFFYDLFKKANFGPFSSDRENFYAEIQRLVNLGKLSANLIVKKTARNVISQHSRKYPWEAAEKFLSNLLHRQPVLLDQGGIERDPTMISSFSQPIVKLKGGWKELLDAELLFFLAEADGALAVAEIETIGFVMYPGINEDERLEKVEKLFGLLNSSGRIITEKGIFIARKSVQSKTFSSGASEIVPLDQFRAETTGADGSPKIVGSLASSIQVNSELVSPKNGFTSPN